MKKKICLLLLLLTLIVVPVKALDIARVEKEDSNFITGDNVSVEKFVSGTAFVAGNTVSISSDVDGAAFIAGNSVSVSGSQDMLFVAGKNVTINEVATKDVFAAGATINIQSSGIRDLYAAAQEIRVDSNIGRNAYLGGEKVTINGTIDGDVEIAAENITIGEEAVITGTLHYPEKANINVAETAQVANEKTYKTTEISKTDSIMLTIRDRFYTFLAMLLIGLILMALNKKVFSKIAKMDKDLGFFAKEVGIGFILLVLLPVAAIIVMCTVIGIPLALISLLIYGIMIYLSVIPTAYYLGHLCLKGKIKNDFLLFTVALLTIYILKLIPGLGSLVGFISLCFGLGVYVDLLRSNIKTK